MRGRGGWCTSRTPELTSDKSVVNSIIMLKFRPIAPKPSGGKDVPGDMLQEERNFSTRNGRAKRKYVRVRGRRRQNNDPCKNRRSKSESSKELENGDRPSEYSMVTSQLLPERSNRNENFSSRDFLINLEDGDGKIRHDVIDDKMVGFGRQLGSQRESFDHSKGQRVEVERRLVESQENTTRSLRGERDGHYADETVFFSSVAKKATYFEGNEYALKSRARVIETWINIECFTDAIMEGLGLGLGLSDKEKVSNLHIDTNPGFVSDNSNNVLWVNEAYKKMVFGEENQESAEEFRVYLVNKEKMPYLWPEFACRVRVEYNRNGRKCTRTAPCDVWRMEFGGFAWKMDFKAALSLGL
ncbi:Uncharacterized protein Adt_20949 [Abeliophyllum distichum]|uniref:DUF7950 domain-containing protein n=1 Tax=Abeliophyllum distichum TaxID=126358 RepID=A0ABD1SY42_9LAMI